jgi:hypothetical protein
MEGSRFDSPAAFASAESLDQTVFATGLAPIGSLAARVASHHLFALLNDRGVATLARCVRGQPCSRTSLANSARHESVLISSGSAANIWLVSVAGTAPAFSLNAQAFSTDSGAVSGESVSLVSLHSEATLLTACHASNVAYVAAVDDRGAHIIAAPHGQPPRLLGTIAQVTLPFEIVCDEIGATVVGANAFQSCSLRDGCTAKIASEGMRRFARVGGELVLVTSTQDGGEGLRVRHGDGLHVLDALPQAIDDDAAHGGLSAREFWIFSAQDALILFATGSTTAVLRSADRGTSWLPTREATEVVARPPPMDRVREASPRVPMRP